MENLAPSVHAENWTTIRSFSPNTPNCTGKILATKTNKQARAGKQAPGWTIQTVTDSQPDDCQTSAGSGRFRNADRSANKLPVEAIFNDENAADRS